MNIRIIALIALTLLIAPGCSTQKSFSPFAKENYFDDVFGYPPAAIARFLHIQDDLPYRPMDLRASEDADDY
tara:strand:- start:445 stop:660 length:216 start_codon:yes stop_codon:yes gene_type:complete